MSKNQAPYRVVWHSNAPWAGSGYGNQTLLFTACMAKDPDFDVKVSANYGLGGMTLRANGVDVLPRGVDPSGVDILAARYDSLKCDAFVGLYDVWTFPSHVLKSRPFTWWIPIDHDPMPKIVRDAVQHVRYPWAMSRHGYDQMTQTGFLPRYIPHGCDTDVFKPMDRKEARAKFEYVAEDDFFIVSVAANKGREDRKNLRTMIHAFAQLVRDNPKCKLYIHTNPTHEMEGFNLNHLVEGLGLNEHVFFPDLYRLTCGGYQPKDLNILYNAADVFLLPSCGEGFGIPVIEAQAAGCPVIVNDFTAQGELVGSGFKIMIDSDDLEYSVYQSYRARVRPSKVVTALKLALDWRGDAAMRKQARDFIVKRYDYRHVWSTYMRPALVSQIESERNDTYYREKRTAERLVLRTVANIKKESA